MKLKLAAVAVALLLFATGAAMAMPGDAPDHAQADNHSQAEENAPEDPADDADDSDGDEADEADADGNESDAAADERRGPPADVPMVGGDAGDANGSQGPPAELPGPVPDFVSDIHSAIHDHLDGSMESGNLGDVISGLTPDEGDSEGDAADVGDGDVSEDAGNSTSAMPDEALAGQ